MARITVEDCIDKFSSRFELVLVAANRARKLHSGDAPTVENDNDKNTVIALREIAEGTLTTEQLKNNLIEEHQTVSLKDEEEELGLENENHETENQDEQVNSDNIDKNQSEQNSTELSNEELNSASDNSNDDTIIDQNDQIEKESTRSLESNPIEDNKNTDNQDIS